MSTRPTTRIALAAGLAVATAITVAPAASVSGAPVGVDDFQISQAGDVPSSTAVAYNATDEEYLVVWEGAGVSLESRIWGRRVDARTGAGIGDAFVIAEIGPGDPTTNVIDPDVVWNSVDNEYLVVFSGDAIADVPPSFVTAFEIYGQRVTSAGALVAPSTRISDMGANDASGSYDAFAPAVAFDPVRDEYLVVWHGDDDTPPLVNGDVEIFGQFLSSTLAELGTNDLRLSDLGGDVDTGGVTDAREPAVAYYSGAYLVAWAGNDDVTGIGPWEIHGQVVDAVTRSETGTDFVVSTDANNVEAYLPSVAADPAGVGAMVVFELLLAGGDSEIFGSFVTGSTPGTNFAISENGDGTFDIDWAQTSYHPALGAYSVVWVGEYDGVTAPNEYEIFHTLVDSSGTALEPVERVSDMVGATTVIHPDVAAGAETTSGIVWVGDDVGTGDTEVFGQFVTPSTDLEIVSKILTSSDPVVAGGPVVFEITYRNNADTAATGVVVSDSIPAGISISSVGSSPTLTELTGAPNYSWAIPTLAPGASGTITLTGTADGTVGGLITNTATIAGNALHVDPTAANDSKSASVTVNVPPEVVTFTIASDGADTAYARSGDTITATITTSEDITTPTVTIAGQAASVSGSGSSWTATLTVDGSTPEGSAVAQITAAQDLSGLPMVVPVDSTNSVTVDLTAPAPTITSGESDPTNTSPFDVTVDFGEDVLGFTGGDLVVVNGSAGTAIGGTNGAYTVPITPTGDGPVTVDMAAGAAADLAANDSLVAAQYALTYDGTAPTPVISSGEADPTNGPTFDVSIDFGEDVSGFLSGDVAVGNGSVTGFSDDGGGAFTATITPVADGAVTVDVAAGAATDTAGTPSLAATQFSITYDATAPTVTIEQAGTQADPTNGSPIVFDVVFSEAVTGFDDADVSIGGTAGATTAVVTPVDGTNYTVEISGMTGDGTVIPTVDVSAAGDAAGNASAASTSTDNIVTFDQTAPTVTVEQAAAQSDPTNGASVLFDVVFSEDVTGLDVADLAVSGTSGATGTGAIISGSGTTYTVEITDVPGDGDVTVSVVSAAAGDAAGNDSEPSTSTDNTVLVDRTAPTVTLEQGATQTDSANTSPVVFDVVFSEDVTGFDGSDVTIGGTAGATTATVTAIDGANYTVAITGMTGNGTVTATVAAATATDTAGNANVASTSVDNVVTYIAGDVTPGVNDAPVVAAPATATAELAEATAFTGANAVSVTDPDALDADIVVTLAADDDETVIRLGTTTGLAVTGNDTASLTLTGSQSDINQALTTLTITANNTGDVTVTVGADDQGNTDGTALTDSSDIVITVTDTVAPTITVPAGGVSATTDPGRAGAVVTFDVVVDDPGSESPARLIELQVAPTLDCVPSSGDFFPIGATTVSCTATDASGNATVESFVVTVVDDEAPVISGATDRTYQLPTGTSGPVTYTLPTATDNSGSATVTCTPASGSTLGVGATTVNCTARDAAGNTATASFRLTVTTTARTPDTGGSLTLLPWAIGLLAAGLLLLGAVGVSRRYGTIDQRTVR